MARRSINSPQLDSIGPTSLSRFDCIARRWQRLLEVSYAIESRPKAESFEATRWQSIEGDPIARSVLKYVCYTERRLRPGERPPLM